MRSSSVRRGTTSAAGAPVSAAARGSPVMRGRGRRAVRRHDLVAADRLAVPRDLVQDAHRVQHAQRAWREAVAAGLVARKLGSVEQHDVEAAAGQKVRGGRAAWPGADDRHVMHRPLIIRGAPEGQSEPDVHRRGSRRSPSAAPAPRSADWSRRARSAAPGTARSAAPR